MSKAHKNDNLPDLNSYVVSTETIKPHFHICLQMECVQNKIEKIALDAIEKNGTHKCKTKKDKKWYINYSSWLFFLSGTVSTIVGGIITFLFYKYF